MFQFTGMKTCFKYPSASYEFKKACLFCYQRMNANLQYWEIFRHGVKQFRTGWSDGPAYITQCPIQPGQSYLYNFTLTGQRGTLLWHSHINWQRATVHGAIVILPKLGVPYPFPKPDKEEIIVLGKVKVPLCSKEFVYLSIIQQPLNHFYGWQENGGIQMLKM